MHNQSENGGLTKKINGFNLAALVLMTIGIATIAYASHPEIQRMPIDELKKLIDSKADVIILDAQLKEIYDKGHIKGALSLPWKADLRDADVEKFDKDKLTVTHCDCGPGEADSSDLGGQLIGLGFTNVRILQDPSVRGWKKAGYPTE
jgi:rhodanese-related sulfurtransferase